MAYVMPNRRLSRSLALVVLAPLPTLETQQGRFIGLG
jgi:hypothetical protein